MRAILAACALLVLGSAAAEAQPFFGYGGGYGYGHHYGYGPRFGYGFRHHPGFGYYGGWRGRRCFWVRGYYGPHRVCHW